jgi:hypothetical protein
MARDSRGRVLVEDRDRFSKPDRANAHFTMQTSKGLIVMTRTARAARESHKGFQPGQHREHAGRHEHAYVTFLMAGALSLATLIAVATVSVEVVTAAVLR